MMDIFMDATLNNLKAFSDFQGRNEDLARAVLDQGAKTREQVLKMQKEAVETLRKQATANETYVKEVMELTRKTFVPSKA